MLPALILACALAPQECHSDDARAIAAAIDAATDDDRLRAVLVVYAVAESHLRLDPAPMSWDARAGLARGPWQMWSSHDLPLAVQARTWLRWVQAGGLAALDSSPRRAARRAARAAQLIASASPGPTP